MAEYSHITSMMDDASINSPGIFGFSDRHMSVLLWSSMLGANVNVEFVMFSDFCKNEKTKIQFYLQPLLIEKTKKD